VKGIGWRHALPAAGLLVLFVLVSRCQSEGWSGERDRLIKAADSLRVQTRADSVRAAILIRQADSLATVARAAQDSAGRAIETADRLRVERRRLLAAAGRWTPARADSVLPPPVDSALTLCEEETVVLRAALDQRRLEADAATQEAQRARAALSIVEVSAATLREQNAALTRALASAAPPCRILFWGCPSRRVAAVGAVVATAVAYEVLRR